MQGSYSYNQPGGALAKLDNWLQATNTAPELRHNIIQGLQKWQKDSPEDKDKTMWQLGATLEQALLGWHNMLQGEELSRKWQEEQTWYWKTHKSRKMCKRWMTKLIKRLIMTAWNMWQHCNKALHEDKGN